MSRYSMYLERKLRLTTVKEFNTCLNLQLTAKSTARR